MRKTRAFPLFPIPGTTLLLAMIALALQIRPTEAASNPSCANIGVGSSQFSVDNNFDGTHSLGDGQSVTISTNGSYFDWSATTGIEAVIVKGGPEANIYTYSPAAFSDSGLHAPERSAGQPYGLSHITFCYTLPQTTSTPTWTPVPTNTPTNTSTNTPTNTPSNTPTDTPTYTPTYTPSNTPTNTPTFTPTYTPSNTPTNTPTFTPTYTPSNTPTNTPTFTPTNTPTVAPTNVEDNPSCADYGFGSIKLDIESNFNGTHDLGNGYTVTITTSGQYFDWSATLAIDAVIVKGGPSANIYSYTPAVFADSGLHPPLRSNDQPYGLSHVTFCYTYPSVTQTPSIGPTNTPTNTPTSTSTNAATFTPTFTPTSTLTPTITPTAAPTTLVDNPSCAQLGLGPYEYGIVTNLEGLAGTYNLGSGYVLNIITDGKTFDWFSTLSFNGVLVKGGPSVNVYSYIPASSWGFDLSTPINPNNGKPYGLSHAIFCSFSPLGTP